MPPTTPPPSEGVTFTIQAISIGGLAWLLDARSQPIPGLPLTFLSAAFMPLALAPDWDRGHSAVQPGQQCGFVVMRLAGLSIVAVLAATMATQAFRTYQRSA